jgi:uncharacterized membrane protein YeaQ/YmgE (transglycosylase-associated protein family)
MYLLTVLVAGVLVGSSGRFIIPSRLPGQAIICALTGVVGASAGALCAFHLHWFRMPTEPTALLAPVIGAMLLVLSYRAVLPVMET